MRTAIAILTALLLTAPAALAQPEPGQDLPKRLRPANPEVILEISERYSTWQDSDHETTGLCVYGSASLDVVVMEDVIQASHPRECSPEGLVGLLGFVQPPQGKRQAQGMLRMACRLLEHQQNTFPEMEFMGFIYGLKPMRSSDYGIVMIPRTLTCVEPKAPGRRS